MLFNQTCRVTSFKKPLEKALQPTITGCKTDMRRTLREVVILLYFCRVVSLVYKVEDAAEKMNVTSMNVVQLMVACFPRWILFRTVWHRFWSGKITIWENWLTGESPFVEIVCCGWPFCWCVTVYRLDAFGGVFCDELVELKRHKDSFLRGVHTRVTSGHICCCFGELVHHYWLDVRKWGPLSLVVILGEWY